MEAAALSLKVDSSDVVKATADLDKFAASAKKAGAAGSSSSGWSSKLAAEAQRYAKLAATIEATEKATRAAKAANDNQAGSAAKAAAANDSLAKTSNAAASGQARVTAEAAKAARAIADADAHVSAYRQHLQSLAAANNSAAAGIRQTTVAATESAGAMKANVGNIAAQFQDIGVTASMGMSPMMIALQQGTQLAGVFAASGGSAFKALGGAILSVISPTSILTIALVALVAAGIQMVDWSNLAKRALNGLADAMPQVATAAVYMGGVLALAFAPQILSAILTATSYIGVGLVNAIVTATKAMVAFSLANPMGAFVIAVGAAAAAIWAFNDDISKVMGFNVLAKVKQAANYVIGAFVGAFHDVQFVWKNFPAIMGAAATGATNAVIRSINWLLEKGASGINALINSVNSALAMLGIGPIGNVVAPQLAEFANKAADGLSKAVTARNAQLQKDLTTDYIGAFGNAIDEASKWAQGKIRGLAGSIGAEAGKKAGGSSADAARSAADKAKWAPEVPVVLNPIMDLPRDTLPKLPDLQPMQTSMTRLYETMKEARLEAKSFFTDWINGVRNGESVFKSFTNAISNSLNRLIDQMINQMLNQMLGIGPGGVGGMAGMGGMSGGLAGGAGAIVGGMLGTMLGKGLVSLFGGLFANGGAFGTAQRFANGGAFTNQIYNTPTLFRFANGTKMGEMGEAGPEAIMPLKRGANGSLGVQVHGGGKPSIRMGDVHIHNSLAGAIGPEGLAAALQQSGERTVAQIRRDLQSMLQQLDNDGAMI